MKESAAVQSLAGVNFGKFQIMLLCFQIMTFILYGRCTIYNEDASSMANYGFFQNVNVMIFVGFGFLMTFMRKYGWGAVGFTFLFSIVAFQWDILCLGFFHQAYQTGVLKVDWEPIPIDTFSIMNADFCAAAVMITFGGVIGKISHLQMLMVTFMEVIFYAVNEMIVYLAFGVIDAGGSIVIHAFGAYFGLALSFMVGNPGKGVRAAETSHKNGIFAMIGTTFLWMYWPSFNAGPLTNPVDQQRAVINTILSIGSSTLAVFCFSNAMRGKKFEMEDIQNATLAGGVAMGACASMRVDPFGALLIGFSAGLLSNVGFLFGSNILKKVSIDDTCGIHNLHGMPAVLGAVASAIAAGCAKSENYGGDAGLAGVFPARQSCTGFTSSSYSFFCGRTGGQQAGYQLAGITLAVFFGIFGGLVTGFIVRRPFFEPLQAEECFEDYVAWNVDDGDVADLGGERHPHLGASRARMKRSDSIMEHSPSRAFSPPKAYVPAEAGASGMKAVVANV